MIQTEKMGIFSSNNVKQQQNRDVIQLRSDAVENQPLGFIGDEGLQWSKGSLPYRNSFSDWLLFAC